jgi:hypothetical protein
VEELERIAGRLAHAVSAGQTPEEMLESACLVAELATEFDAVQNRKQAAGLDDPVTVPSSPGSS